MHYTKIVVLSALLSITGTLPLAAQQAKPSLMERELVTLNAEVTAVDPATRLVTLRGENGNVVQIVAGEQVRNFDQIDIGDKVVTQVYLAAAVEVTETDDKTLRTTISTDAARTASGDKPGGLAIAQITVTAEVMAVDKDAQTVTIKRQNNGEPAIILQTVEVKNPTNLENVDVGDMVVMTYQQSVAISVQEVE